MPYDKIGDLPDTVKNLPKEAKEIYMSAFNSAYEQYQGEEGREAHAHATAWATVEKKYHKVDGRWVARESLQTVYAEIIQEIGRRNAAKDSSRIKSIIKLCQELLDSEDEDKVEEALTEACDVLNSLKEMELVKLEEGVQYPKRAYIYTPDDSEWQLRIWESLDKKVTKSQLGRVCAMISPGGFKGQMARIPSEHIEEVKRRLRAEYRKLDMEDKMPNIIKEHEARTLIDDVLTLEEASISSKGLATIVVIKPGFNASKDRYYPEDVLRRDFGIFEGIKMYADHPSEDEERNRPERSIRDWVATLKNVRYIDGTGVVAEAVIVEPWMQAKLSHLRDNKMLEDMGISINAIGTATVSEVEGVKTNVIEKLVRARSVDFVTEPGAGGMVQMYESVDVDLINEEMLKERRPDLIQSIWNEAKNEALQEVKHVSELEDRIKELEGQVESLTTERDEFQSKVEEAEKATRIAEAKSAIDEAISKTELPDISKTRILEKFKDSETSEGIEGAIQEEVNYVSSIRETGKVEKLGDTEPDKTVNREALKQSLMRSGLTEEQAEIAANK